MPNSLANSRSPSVSSPETWSHRYLELLKQTLTAAVYPESSGFVIEDHIYRTLRHPLAMLKSVVYSWVVKYCRQRSIVLIKKQPFDQHRRDSGLDWPLFGYTMTGRKRLDNLQFCIEDVLDRDVPGDFAETGVWRGGAVIFMRAVLQVHGVTDRVIWAADSFAGMPKPVDSADGLDLRHFDYLNVSLDVVKQNLERFGLLDEQVQFLEGWFSDTLPKAPIERLALLRLDGDLYHSTMDALSSLYDKVSPGGYVIVDDYHSWESCKRAVTDFLMSRKITADIREIDGSAVYWQVSGSGG